MAAEHTPGISQRSDLSFLLKKGSLAFLLRALTMAGQYLLVFTLARQYGAAVMGNFTLALTLLQLFAILAQLGLDNRLTRVIAASGNPFDRNKVCNAYSQSTYLTFISSLVCSVLLFISAETLATFVFKKPQLSASIRYIAVALTPFVLMGINGAAFRGLKNMTGFLIFRGLIPFLTVIPLLLNSENISPAFAYMAATVALCGLSFVTWYRYSRIGLSSAAYPLSSSEVLRESLPMMLTGSIFFLLNWTDNLMLGIFRTETEVGLYDTGFKIASASGIILMAFNSIQAPTFSAHFASKNMRALNRQVQQSTRIIFFITLPFTLVLFLFGDFILGIFGEEFISARDAMLILAIGSFISCISGSVGILLQMTGNQNAYNRIVVVAAFGSILLNIWLIPAYGILGAAISSSLAKIFHNIASVIYAYRKMGIMTFYVPGISKIFPAKNLPAA